MALLLWFHVATDRSYEYAVTFPLEIVNVPSHFVLAERLPDQVQVKVRGKGKELLKLLLAERQSLRIDAKELKTQETTYVIKPGQIPIPEGLELQVTDIVSPQELKIKLDHLVEKRVRVEADVTILPKDGFARAGELHYNPKEVVISGPKAWVDGLTAVHTERKIIENADASISGVVDLVAPPGYNIHLSSKNVNFSADIQKAKEKAISNLQVELSNVPKHREIASLPDNVSVIISGPESLIDQMSADEIKVVVDCAGTGKGEQTKLPVLIRLPSGVSLNRVEPDSVEITEK